MRVTFLILAFQAFALALSAQTNSACKDITIAGPAGITAPGGTMVLKVNSVTPLPADTKYEWSVSAGTIVSGQGSGTIAVEAASASEPAVVATVEVSGLQPPCDEIVSEAYGISSPIIDPILDQWEKLNRNDQRARLQNAAYQLSRNPGDILIIIIYVAPNESLANARSRAEFVRNFFAHDRLVMSKDLHVPADRLLIVFGRIGTSLTSVSIVPPSIAKTLQFAQRPEDLKPISN